MLSFPCRPDFSLTVSDPTAQLQPFTNCEAIRHVISVESWRVESWPSNHVWKSGCIHSNEISCNFDWDWNFYCTVSWRWFMACGLCCWSVFLVGRKVTVWNVIHLRSLTRGWRCVTLKTRKVTIFELLIVFWLVLTSPPSVGVGGWKSQNNGLVTDALFFSSPCLVLHTCFMLRAKCRIYLA